MKTVIQSDALNYAIKLVSKQVNKKTNVPITEDYLVQVSPDSVKVSATDLQGTLTVELPSSACNSKDSFSFVLPSESAKYFAKMDSCPIVISYDGETYSIEVLADDERAKYAGDNPADFPKAPTIDGETTTIVADKSLFEDFATVLPYVSGDLLRPAMTGIYFDNARTTELVATDAHRIIVQKTDADVIGKNRLSFIVPEKACKLLSGLKFKKNENVIINITANESNARFYFALDGFRIEYIVRTINERFPDYRSVMPQGTAPTVYTGISVNEFTKVIDKALLFANKVSHHVRLTVNGKIDISAEDLDFKKEFCKQISGHYTGPEIQIGFNGEFLAESLKSLEGTVTVKMWARNKAAIFSDGRNRSEILIMPIILESHTGKSAEELATELREAREAARKVA